MRSYSCLLLLVIFFLGIFTSSCAHTKNNTQESSGGVEEDLYDLEKELDNQPLESSRHINHVEASHWMGLINSVEKRLRYQQKFGKITENELFTLKVRLTKLIEMGMEHYKVFPPEIEQDLLSIIAEIDHSIVSYNDPKHISVVEVPSFYRKNAPPDLNKPFKFVWPVSKVEISSPYGQRYDPFTGKLSFHDAIDLADREGTLIYAAERGRIAYVGFKGRAGNVIVIDHLNGYKTYYAHLKQFLTVKGLFVERGQPIGLMGSTGRSTGPHVHFKITYRGQSLNPDKYVGALLD